MNHVLRSLTLAAVVCGLALPLAAAPKDAAKKDAAKKADKEQARPAAMYKLPATISLSDEQKTKLAAIEKEFTPKFRELAAKNNEILTREQKKARREATESAKAAGTKGKKRQARIEEAMKLSPEQKEKLDKVKTETATLRGNMQEKVVSLLTPEQKEQLPQPKKGKRANRNKKAA